jgi:hypothetical protein
MHAPLLAFGFVWMVVATLIGMVLGAKHDTHLETLRQYARDGKLAAYNEATEKYQAGATAHGHSFLFAVILVFGGNDCDKIALCSSHHSFHPVCADLLHDFVDRFRAQSDSPAYDGCRSGIFLDCDYRRLRFRHDGFVAEGRTSRCRPALQPHPTWKSA